MIPLTNKEIKLTIRQKCCRLCISRNVVKYLSLHGVISTLLLPLTIRGPIGGQYGVLTSFNDETERTDIISVTDVPFALEMFLISLLFLAHLIGFISVIKKSMRGMVFYILVRVLEFCLSACWMKSVIRGAIKSHVMSQDSLTWYCFVAFAIEFISVLAVIEYALDIPKKDK